MASEIPTMIRETEVSEMIGTNMTIRKQRDLLLDRWVNAGRSEKVDILGEIMLIDELLETGERSSLIPPRRSRWVKWIRR